MLGARSSPFHFVSRITVLLLVWAELVCFSASQMTTCTMPSVEEGQAAAFTCLFGFDMQEEDQRRDVIIKRMRTTSSKQEELLECYQRSDEYRCKVKNPRFYFDDVITDHVTLRLLNANQEDEGQYYCVVTGQRAASCNFSVEANKEPMTICTMPSVEEGQAAEFTCFLPSTLESEPPSVVLIRRNTGRTDDPEEIGECDKQNGTFTCKKKLDKARISYYNNTQVNLFLLNGKKEDAGEYYCETLGATPVPCKFTIRDRCKMPSVEEGATAVFSCYHSGAEDVSIKRELDNRSKREEIGKCVRTNGNSEMQCESKNDRVAVRFNSTHITVSLEHVEKKDEGEYFCETILTTSAPCQLTVRESSSSNTAAIVLGVLLSLVICGAVAGGGFYCWKKRRGEASDHDVNNAKKGGVWRRLLSRFSTEQRKPERTEAMSSPSSTDPLGEVVECRSDNGEQETHGCRLHDVCLNTPRPQSV